MFLFDKPIRDLYQRGTLAILMFYTRFARIAVYVHTLNLYVSVQLLYKILIQYYLTRYSFSRDCTPRRFSFFRDLNPVRE